MMSTEDVRRSDYGSADDLDQHVSVIVAPTGMTIFGKPVATRWVIAACVVGMLAASTILTFVAPIVSADPYPWNYISAFIGWLYFCAWGVSFVPQLYINYARRSVVGQSFDFVVYNCLGFACYSVYNGCFFWSTAIQDEYMGRYDGDKNTVALNDVVFALYALSCSLLNAFQIAIFYRGNQAVSRITIVVTSVALLFLSVWLILLFAGVRANPFLNYLDFLYGLSIVKLGVSVVKYIPQLYLNYVRKLTHGWSIWNVLLDFSGGSLSITQQVIDSATTGNWNGIVGNPVKFCLGLLSMLYDVLFVLQHFWWYRENNHRVASVEEGRDETSSIAGSSIMSDKETSPVVAAGEPFPRVANDTELISHSHQHKR